MRREKEAKNQRGGEGSFAKYSGEKWLVWSAVLQSEGWEERALEKRKRRSVWGEGKVDIKLDGD